MSLELFPLLLLLLLLLLLMTKITIYITVTYKMWGFVPSDLHRLILSIIKEFLFLGTVNNPIFQVRNLTRIFRVVLHGNIDLEAITEKQFSLRGHVQVQQSSVWLSPLSF